jgi:hypothetical protein
MSGHDPLYGLSDEAADRLNAELDANPLLERYFIELDEGCVETWRRSSNPGQREAAHFEMVAIQALRHKIKGRIDAVKLELASRRKRSLGG